MSNVDAAVREAAKGNLDPLKQQIPSAEQVQQEASKQLQKAKDSIPKSTEELKENVEQAAKKSFQSLRDFVAGGVGGICAVVVGHPFDLVKVRLQTAEKGVYTGAMDVVRKTIAREGPVRVSAYPMGCDTWLCHDVSGEKMFVSPRLAEQSLRQPGKRHSLA